MRRSVAVVLTFLFAAKSYVQKSCVLPTSSAGGVVRTGSKPFAGWPDRPRTVRVSSNPFAYGSVFASRAAVISKVLKVDDASGVGVLGTGVPTDPVDDGLGEACGGMHPARRTASATRANHRRRITSRDTPRRAFGLRRSSRRGNIGGERAGGWR